jgi:hypothetical protein
MPIQKKKQNFLQSQKHHTYRMFPQNKIPIANSKNAIKFDWNTYNLTCALIKLKRKRKKKRVKMSICLFKGF